MESLTIIEFTLTADPFDLRSGAFGNAQSFRGLCALNEVADIFEKGDYFEREFSGSLLQLRRLVCDFFFIFQGGKMPWKK